MRVAMTGDIDLAGTLAKPRVRGALVVDDALVQPEFGGRDVHRIGLPPDVVFVSAADSLEDSEREVAERVESATASSLGMDIDFRVELPPRQVLIRNDIVEVELEGEITAVTRGDALSIKGVITVIKGKLQLFGLTFVLEGDSKVVLDGARVIDPILDVRAAHDISEVDLSPIGLTADRDSRIYVHVTGTATAPELELTSDPAMDETHILSILAIGKPIGDIAASSNEESSMESQVLSTVVGLAMGTVSKLVTENLPIDVFELEAGGDRGFEETEFRIGKRITRDLLLLYEMNLGAEDDENVHQLRMEYAITRRLAFETHFGDAGQGGAELMFRWRF
jgi:translocation and assembly module TamB